MKYLEEFRDPEVALRLIDDIAEAATRHWVLMEVCGGQTHSIIRNGIDRLLPDTIELVHGPGCPVCVTPLDTIDQALAIASSTDIIFCSFGDMLRVPGSNQDLFQVKSHGGDVRVVYSPLDAVQIARDNPDRQVVFFAIGFETTAPANAMAVHQADQEGLENFSMLVSHVLVPPAMRAVLDSPTNRVEAFLAAGHVCSVMGYEQYFAIAEQYRTPVVVTGFEPLDLLQGIKMAVAQLEVGRSAVENAYPRAVTQQGNLDARSMIADVFVTTDRNWRGIGPIPQSGWKLSPRYRSFDAAERFAVGHINTTESPRCHAGEVLQGTLKPDQCPAFGRECTPRTPLGAPMVSSEGACAAYHQYGRLQLSATP